jgi:CBS domain-containing protein
MRSSRNAGQSAGGIMSKNLVTVPLGCTLQGLAVILHENGISGVPVVDDDGLLVGVVSQSDLVRFGTQRVARPRIVPLDFRNEQEVTDEDEAGPIAPAFHTTLDGEDLAELRERFIEEDYGDALVADIYTPYAVTASVDASVAALASLMVEKGVHRLIIVDGKRVAGIVTSMDILKTFARPRPATSRTCLVAH